MIPIEDRMMLEIPEPFVGLDLEDTSSEVFPADSLDLPVGWVPDLYGFYCHFDSECHCGFCPDYIEEEDDDVCEGGVPAPRLVCVELNPGPKGGKGKSGYDSEDG